MLVNSLKANVPILLVTHDILIAIQTDLVYVFENESLQKYGTPKQLLLNHSRYRDIASNIDENLSLVEKN